MLAISLAVVVFGLAYGLFCAIAPRKAILMQTRFSTLLTAESTLDRKLVLQWRIFGVIFTLGAAFFGLVIADYFHKFWNAVDVR
jgi:hypothetical protein